MSDTISEFGLNMYDNTPSHECTFGNLAKFCQQRIDTYVHINQYMEKNRLQEDNEGTSDQVK